MMRGILVSFLLLAGCDNEKKKTELAAAARLQEAVALEQEAKELLSEVMFDPTAILVRKLTRGGDRAGKAAICGEVNGKNRMGGYVGYRGFVAIKGVEDAILTDAAAGDRFPTPEQLGESYLYRARYAENCGSRPDKISDDVMLVAQKGERKAAPGPAPGPAPAPAPAPVVSQAAISKLSALPVAYRGEWRDSLDKCGSDMDDFVYDVQANYVGRYEGGGKVRSVVATGARSVKVVLDNSGEGENWISVETFSLSASGKLSTRNQDGQRGGPYTRCRN